MKLSTRARYGIHAMYDLALCGRETPQPLKLIAERQDIPEAYLEQLMAQLRKAGVVVSSRGAQGGYTLDSLQAELYAIPKRIYPDKTEDKNALKEVQSKFFKDVYNLILARDKGPRLYLYLFAVESSRYLSLLDFSLPESEDPDAREEEAPAPAVSEESAPAEEKYVAEPAPVKQQIESEDFAKCDLRVCKVLAAKPMRKTNKLMKLTLHDGMGERVIVSSIADQYEPEQLIGKKIVVLVNLKPHKFGNEYSNGMLLASTDTDGVCHVLFTAENAEIGSLVH